MSNDSSPGQLMKAYNARVASIVSGLQEGAVRDILGEPITVTRRDTTKGPSDFFNEIGSIFRFPDADADVVWVYGDPYRPRVRHYIGFRRGVVCAVWKETLTIERLEELKR